MYNVIFNPLTFIFLKSICIFYFPNQVNFQFPILCIVFEPDVNFLLCCLWFTINSVWMKPAPWGEQSFISLISSAFPNFTKICFLWDQTNYPHTHLVRALPHCTQAEIRPASHLLNIKFLLGGCMSKIQSKIFA